MDLRDVCDEISLLCEKINNASFLSQEIREEYFEKYDSDTESGMNGIVWEFNRNKAFFTILDDYAFGIRKKLNEMNSFLQEAYKKSPVATNNPE